MTRLVASGVPVTAELKVGKLAEAMEKENKGIKWAARDPTHLGEAWGRTQRATVVSFEVYDYDDAAKLIKEEIMIGGKKRHMELFKATPKKTVPSSHKSPVTMGQMKEFVYGRKDRQQQLQQRSQGSRCMGCPIYRTGGKAHDIGKCPLRNRYDSTDNTNNNNVNTADNQGRKRSSTGAGSPAQRARTYV